ncbi:type II toxin-antitoxin system Phd/YefM family antitoxin [Nitrosomonas ureae]|uniref:Antitoxin n=1 Tax=Nitrosomonas ureae TaxID=44577 RepID=A0A286AMA8_9PROT|nr:type II toxin-antitoxin system Phd/YefM family antitoxin [Nitrosomonas ureae]SOD23033.1 prevent-host-death family protein [Nitrosomonas ureae]
METFNATDVKRDFGEMLLKVQKAPVAINKNGKPVAVMLSSSDYQYLEALHNQWLKTEIQKGIDDIAAGNVIDGKAVFAALRKQVEDGAI